MKEYFSRNQTVVTWIVTLGLLLVMAGTLLPLLRVSSDVWKYLYGCGAVVLVFGRLMTVVPDDTPLRLRRLYRLETWSALLFCVGCFFMFYEAAGTMDWLAFTLAGGAIQAYTSIMIPRTIKKQQ